MAEADFPINPRLRPVEAIPLQGDGQEYVCLRDPQCLADQPVFLTKSLLFLVSRMDGTNSLRDIQADFMRATGEIFPIENLEGLVQQLDEHHYLDSARFREYYQKMVEEFRKSPVRRPSHAGTAYEGTHDALISQLAGFFGHPDGPGPHRAPDPSRPLRGLVAPHIDFHRGGPTYAHAYHALVDHPGADRFIIFGTSHSPLQQRFAFTAKAYDTPLGAAETDRRFVERLAAAFGRDYFLDEFSHRGEHSIEFQAVCLKYFLGDQTKFEIIPILVGSFHDILSEGKTAAQDPEITEMIDGVRRTMEDLPGRYCIIAAADLAHVGRRFGHMTGPTEYSLREVESEDRRFLAYVEAGDAEGMFLSIAAENDKRNVCGYPPIYIALRCLESPSGQLLQYRQWADLKAGAAVTIAAVALY